MTGAEMMTIRLRLRAVNIEYSGLVRDKQGESRFVRMQALKAERETLVGLIVQNEKSALPPLSAATTSEPLLQAAL